MTPCVHHYARILLVAGVLLLCAGPVSAIDRIAIDPVPGNPTAGSVIGFTGTTTLPAGTVLKYEFSRKDSGNGSVRYGEYSGTEGTVLVENGANGPVWNVPILTQDYAPADYIFRIGESGSGDRVSVQVRLARGEETPVPTPAVTETSRCGEFKSPMYISPGGTFAVSTVPDLNTRCSILAKGAPLTINAGTSSGSRVGIWITSASPATGYTHFGQISSDSSGAEYTIPDTAPLRSGQYFFYVVDGGDALKVLPDEKNQSAYLPTDVLESRLKAYEKDNPYQKFMILLEEPVISMDDIPDAVSGTSVGLNGTTNLNTGALLDISVLLADIDHQKQPAFAIAGVPVADSTGKDGSWHAVINTSSLSPGEYIVKVRNGSTEATGLMVIYNSLYDTGASSGDGFISTTYAVDPESKTVVTGTPAPKAGPSPDPAILVLAGLAGFACLCVIAGSVRKK
ncbi:MAG: hypothetical protein WCX63_07990 [Methanoregula sp.]